MPERKDTPPLDERAQPRAVHRGPDGREYVRGHNGERVYGVWEVPEDEPVVV
jgi:hypothetical protein